MIFDKNKFDICLIKLLIKIINLTNYSSNFKRNIFKSYLIKIGVSSII